MKILLISSDEKLMDEITFSLNGSGVMHMITSVKGGVDSILNSANLNHPDLIILDCSQADNTQLNLLESLVPQYQNTGFILLRNIISPEFLIYSIRMGVKDVLPLPIVQGDLIQAVMRIGKIPTVITPPSKQGRVIAFIGVKGGVGSTFIACNFSYILAAVHDKKVALFDLDLQFGDALLYLSDNPPTNNLSDLVEDISRLDASLLASSMVNILPNLGVLAAPEDAEKSECVKSEHIEALLKLARSQYDYVVLDIGRTINSVSVKALDHADVIFLVTQATLPCIRASKRLISTFTSLGYSKDKINLIINRYDKSSDIQVEDIELTSGVKIFAMIPNSYVCVSASVNQGVPVINISKNNSVTNALCEVVKKIDVGPIVKKEGWLLSLLNRL